MSSAYGQNNRTLKLDTLFVRDIIFKDLLEPDSAYITEDIVNSINFQFYSAI
jgi:hypothetical protein